MDAAEISVLVLTYTTALVLFVVSVFLVKLLIDLSKLARTANDAGEMLNRELEPTLKEMREASETVNSMVKNAEGRLSGLGKVLARLAGTTKDVGSKMGGLLQGLVKGISVGIKLFSKR